MSVAVSCLSDERPPCKACEEVDVGREFAVPQNLSGTMKIKSSPQHWWVLLPGTEEVRHTSQPSVTMLQVGIHSPSQDWRWRRQALTTCSPTVMFGVQFDTGTGSPLHQDQGALLCCCLHPCSPCMTAPTASSHRVTSDYVLCNQALSP